MTNEERITALREYEKRASICVNALAGIDDPEAFMRDVECLVFSDEGDDAGFQAWLRLQKIFMKGTDQ